MKNKMKHFSRNLVLLGECLSGIDEQRKIMKRKWDGWERCAESVSKNSMEEERKGKT